MRNALARRGIIAALVATTTGAEPLAGHATTGAAPTAATLRDGTLSFDGHATTGDFVGTTEHVSGDVAATADLASVRGWVEASVATLHTGNGLRDRDLRKVMDVGTYPTMRYDLSSASVGPVTTAAGAADAPRHAVLHGTLRLHGVSRAVDVPVTIARVADTAHVMGTFPVDVRDYQVGGLSKMGGLLKMRPGIEVHVDLRFVVP